MFVFLYDVVFRNQYYCSIFSWDYNEHQIIYSWGSWLFCVCMFFSMPAVPSKVQSVLWRDYYAFCMLIPIFLSMWPILYFVLIVLSVCNLEILVQINLLGFHYVSVCSVSHPL